MPKFTPKTVRKIGKVAAKREAQKAQENSQISTTTERVEYTPRTTIPLSSRRSLFKAYYVSGDQNSVERSINTIIPWHWSEYPGRGRGMEELFGNHVKRTSVANWMRRGRAPMWALKVLEHHLAARVAKSVEVLEAIRADIARAELEPLVQVGFAVVTENGDKRRFGGKGAGYGQGSGSIAEPAGLLASLGVAA